MYGGRIGFYSGDVKKLIDDVKELKPTLFIAVPRILYRIYDKVHCDFCVCCFKVLYLGYVGSITICSEAILV